MAQSKKSTKNLIPSVLSYSSKIAVSNAPMMQTKWEERNTSTADYIQVTTSYIPLTKTDDYNELAEANPVKCDEARLADGNNTLKIEFNVKMLGNVAKSIISRDNFDKDFIPKINKFREKYGTYELAKRYAYNIANGRFLWRNKVSNDGLEIIVNLKDKNLTFNGNEFSLINFDKNADNANLKELAQAIQEVLDDKVDHLSFTVTAYVKIAKELQVYPSQEGVDKEKGRGKVLYQMTRQGKNNIAGIHSQKIGNAIRTIDTWYDDYEEEEKVLPIEPYASDTFAKEIHRPVDSESNLYAIMKKCMADQELTAEEFYYLYACLIRGGLFGIKDKKDK